MPRTKAASQALYAAVTEATVAACREAVIHLPADVRRVLEEARVRESNPVAQGELANILADLACAEEHQVPLCQDTGVPVIYMTIPSTVPLTEDLYDAVRAGVRRATAEVPLRPNVVDPITRVNSGDNTGEGMPAIHVRPGETLSITVLPKGAGAENTSQIAMFLPSQKDRIEEFVVKTVLAAGSRPCPPLVIGIGIGGTFDGAAALAKEALLQPIDRMDPFEQHLCDNLNTLGIGPMGLGGDTSVLAVKVKKGACHTASLPVAVNVQCWANRRATVVVEVD
jgi:fumarate hydratase subunit alpha